QTLGLLDAHVFAKGLLTLGEQLPLIGGLVKGAATTILDVEEADKRKTACQPTVRLNVSRRACSPSPSPTTRARTRPPSPPSSRRSGSGRNAVSTFRCCRFRR